MSQLILDILNPDNEEELYFSKKQQNEDVISEKEKFLKNYKTQKQVININGEIVSVES
jgi:hypothetical protein